MRTVGAFLESFVLPLVRGGEARVARPISAVELNDFEMSLGDASPELVAVDDARTAVLADIVVRPPALVFDADELYLAAAVHNLLWFAHPRADTWTVTNRAESRVLDTAGYFARRPLTGNRTRVLARHSLLHNLFDLSRTDVRLTWWTGSATFLGQTPPSRLRAWRSLRRVREEISTVTFEDLLGAAEVAPVISTLLRRSPLTQLLCVSPDGPDLHWEDVAFLLRDAELARAVAYRAVRPRDPRAMVEVPARFAAAFEQMLERMPPEPDVRAVAAFLVHLNALLALGEVHAKERQARSPLLAAVLSPERAGSRPRGLASFFALPAALALVDPRMAEPPGLREETALAQRWDQHRAQVLDGVGEAVVETLAGRLRRHMTGVLESRSNDHGDATDPG